MVPLELMEDRYRGMYCSSCSSGDVFTTGESPRMNPTNEKGYQYFVQSKRDSIYGRLGIV